MVEALSCGVRCRCLAPVADAELAQDRSDVALGCANADGELSRDLTVGALLGDQPQDLMLPSRERDPADVEVLAMPGEMPARQSDCIRKANGVGRSRGKSRRATGQDRWALPGA